MDQRRVPNFYTQGFSSEDGILILRTNLVQFMELVQCNIFAKVRLSLKENYFFASLSLLLPSQIAISHYKSNQAIFPHPPRLWPHYFISNFSWVTFVTCFTRPSPRTTSTCLKTSRKRSGANSRNTWSDRHGSNQALSVSQSKSGTPTKCTTAPKQGKGFTHRVSWTCISLHLGLSIRQSFFLYILIYLSIYLSIILSIILSIYII